MCCNSFNSSISPSFRFQRFDFKGKSVRLKRRIKALSKVCMLSRQRASSPGHSGGWAGKVRRACNYVSGIWIPPPIPPSTELSDFCQSVQRGSECGCKQTLKNMWKHAPRVDTLLMSSPPISILHWLFQYRYSNSRDIVAISPSFPPTTKTPLKACLPAICLVARPLVACKNRRFSSLIAAGVHCAKRNVCDSATEISYWWHKTCPESGHKRWLDVGVVILFHPLFMNDRQKTRGFYTKLIYNHDEPITN